MIRPGYGGAHGNTSRRGLKMARSKSSQHWLDEHHQDEFVLKARREGYRSRAVYKLIEIDNKDHLFRPDQLVVDLGAAPGGWSEYAVKAVGESGRVIGLDLLPVEPVAGMQFIQGDFTEQEVLDELISLVEGHKAGVVLSDMAPNLSGMESVDQPRAMYLAELALDFAVEFLAKDGKFVVKLFQGSGFEAYVATLRQHFVSVRFRKPQASRDRSSETYAVCVGLK